MSKPQIALVITDQESNSEIKSCHVDLLELRIDLFKNQNPSAIISNIKQRRKLRIPLLLTVRNQKQEGALKDTPNAAKKALIEACLPCVDMIDIELSSALLKPVIQMARAQRKKVIVSSHNFHHTPLHLESILKKSLSTRADIIKIAAKANSWDDVLRLIDFTRIHSRKHKLITMSLGPLGRISRILLPAAGSLYTYSFLKKASAPGQIDLKTLRSHLKFYYP